MKNIINFIKTEELSVSPTETGVIISVSNLCSFSLTKEEAKEFVRILNEAIEYEEPEWEGPVFI